MSESLAGVTLLAFGNGAPDVLTAVLAGGDGDDGISLTIGSIFGAGTFVTLLALSRCIDCAGTIKIPSSQFNRDVSFYFIGTTVLIIYTLIGTIELY